jgi:hypothetical protein
VKHVLCFGDSNTWGTKDLQDSFPDRFDLKVRWTGQLATTFGGVARIVEEGMAASGHSILGKHLAEKVKEILAV